MLTPEMLAELKLTLADLPESDYDHETQTRKFKEDIQVREHMYPDTQFDHESK